MLVIDWLQEATGWPTEEKPALVVQGGGMRGIYSLGAIATLEDHNLLEAFQVVIGSSAGAVNGAYFLTGQAREGLDVYKRELSDRRFISLTRVSKVVDIDYFIDTALKQVHPFDVGALRDSPVKLLVALTDAATGDGTVVDARLAEYDPYELFRATSALPALYDRLVDVNGHLYIDGGFAMPLPLRIAWEAGATEAIVLCTRGPGYRRDGTGGLQAALAKRLARNQTEVLKARFGEPSTEYNEDMQELEGERQGANRRTWTVWPSRLDDLVGRTTNSNAKLARCEDMGRSDMARLLMEPKFEL